MAENTKIEWTDHTFNPWTGCTAVSPACDNCYAEGWAKRSGHVQWGPHGDRRRTSEANWRLPIKWNAEAAKAGKRARVFCASLADVFDNHRSIDEKWRADLWELIAATPSLNWLLLTKRPQNIRRYLPDQGLSGFAPQYWGNGWPNVWLGTTVENQVEADRRIPHLLAVPAKVRFLSCEPLLGPVDLSQICDGWKFIDPLRGQWWHDADEGLVEYGKPRLDWVICGGESGPGARPIHPDWARSLRDQCQAAGVAFHFKQWGEFSPFAPVSTKLPLTLRPRQYWRVGPAVYRVGKKAAGRLLDGRTWDEAPSP